MKLNDLIHNLQLIAKDKGNVDVKISSVIEPNTTGVLLQGGYLLAIGETQLGKDKDLPTPKQVVLLNVIYKALNLVCVETSRTSIKQFITQHKDKVANLDLIMTREDYVYSFPTPNQLSYIKSLETKTGILFEGTTFEEASHYIAYAHTGSQPPKFTGRTQSHPLNTTENTVECRFEPCMFVDEDEIPF